MFDGYIWRGANGGFTICTLLGCTFASIVGGIYQIIYIIKNVIGKNKLFDFIV